MSIELPGFSGRIALPLELASCLGGCTEYLDAIPDQAETVWRRPELQEVAKCVFPESCHTQFTPTVEQNFKLFLEQRHSITGAILIAQERVLHELHRDGAILATDWEASLFDGAVTPETDGFIDDDCMPPWDTWLALTELPGSYGKRCLLSWVPIWLTGQVDFGIQVDAASCMSWLSIDDLGTAHLLGWGKERGQGRNGGRSI